MNLKENIYVSMSCNEDRQISKVTQAEEEKIREIGQKTTNLVLKTLQKELKTTIENEGMLAALSVCNNKAKKLTDSISRSMDSIVEVKRTSLRYRNPRNAPDAEERKAIAYFQSTLLQSGKLSEDLIEKVGEASSAYFRYYKPLVVKSLCLNCHGPSEMIAPGILYRLKKLYPGDHATGYKIDQLRGKSK
jgi:hypothetical protein